jgi:hypothetical protein
MYIPVTEYNLFLGTIVTQGAQITPLLENNHQRTLGSDSSQ